MRLNQGPGVSRGHLRGPVKCLTVTDYGVFKKPFPSHLKECESRGTGLLQIIWKTFALFGSDWIVVAGVKGYAAHLAHAS